ncbi:MULTISPECIES: hypothetical protein [Bacillus]|uniref:hypothetical protein n=1 Tax=Bacillus TaxID=1386 RepID=UPI0002E194D9|nr:MULTISPECIES: hypothetical protein [Bacillus]
MRKQNVIICPNCHSHKVKKLLNLPLMMFALAFATAWFESIGWMISLFFLILGIAMILKDNGGKRMKCLNCGENFRVSKKTFHEYKLQKEENH